MPRRPMGPPPKMEKGRMKSVFLRLLKYIVGVYKIQFVVVVLCIILTAACSAIGTGLLQNLIDEGIMPQIGAAHPDFTRLYQVCAMMGAAYGVMALCQWVQARLMINVTQGTIYTIRTEMMKKMQSLPLSYFDTNAHGDIMSCYTNDTDTLRQMISQGLPQVTSSVLTIVVVFGSMIRLSWQLSLVVIAFLLFIVYAGKFLGGKSARYYVAQQKSVGKVNGYIEEMLGGQKVVKVFNHEEQSKAEFEVLNDELRDNASKAGIFANILMPIMAQMSNFLYFFIAVVGAALIIKGILPISLGVLIAFLQYTKNLTNPITQVSQQISGVVMALAGGDRVFRLIDETPEVDDGKVTIVRVKEENGQLLECVERTGRWAFKVPKEDGTFDFVELKGRVDFKDVTFGYNKEKVVLKDLSLYAKPGQKIAFVGHTGAGKTTITNLINRFYDINEGQILYDGIDVRDIQKSSLRHSLGIVLQDTHLFTGTIKENIRYGNLNATDEEVIAAAKLANAHHFITHLEDGYDTVITGDGGMLSQGQRQLLSIARAAVANPPVLILDEATSSIDTRTESIVQEGMDKLMEGRTVFVIAHRLSTVRNSKAILLLENGVVVERGDHRDLLAQHGKYYQLYTGAFELD
ncbi:MAG: ABC transporter ATP-binding protein/permease [Lachnospiraceae bacterium]|nr:ABC transporter ATP-binding protein/permease [Lachnospiraceae bacterium]